MVTQQELEHARSVVKTIVTSVGNDHDMAMTALTNMCIEDKNLQMLFARVGIELSESQTATRH
jgi:hypothetical protein